MHAKAKTEYLSCAMGNGSWIGERERARRRHDVQFLLSYLSLVAKTVL